MDGKPTLSDLLAYRDGELNDLELEARIAGDSAAQADVEGLRRVKSELARLPPVTPDPAVWDAIEERAGRHRSAWLQRFPLATAATVFLAAALTIVLWNPMPDPTAGGTPGPSVSDPVAQLMLRSQRLESEVFAGAAPAAATSSSEHALLYGIADVDAQLNELYQAENPDAAERERLWRQRVMLLESLADVQRGQAVLRPAIY